MELTFLTRGDESLRNKLLDPTDQTTSTTREVKNLDEIYATLVGMGVQHNCQLLVGSLIHPVKNEAWGNNYNKYSKLSFIVATTPPANTAHIKLGNKYLYQLAGQIPAHTATTFDATAITEQVVILSDPQLINGQHKTVELTDEMITELANAKIDPTEIAFVDRETNKIYAGTLNIPNNTHTVYKITSGFHLDNFRKSHNLDPKEVLPSLNLVFDPTDNTPMLDLNTKKFNTYLQSDYKTEATKVETATIPPSIDVILSSLCGDAETKEHFIMWLAHSFQTNEKPLTAWLFTGVPGTGKGILFNKIIAPLFGQRYCRLITQNTAEEKYNGWMYQTLFVGVDEIDIGNTTNGRQTLDTLKNYITEPITEIRLMNTDTLSMKTFCNFLFFSNHGDAMTIEPGERRLNVAPHQHAKLPPEAQTTEFMTSLHDQLPEFANYLQSIVVNEVQVNTALDNDAKRIMTQNSRSQHDTFMHALITFDVDYLISQVTSPHPNAIQLAHEGRYILTKLLKNAKNGQTFMAIPEMATLRSLALGDIKGQNDINTYLQHQEISKKTKQPSAFKDPNQTSRKMGHMLPMTLSEIEIADALKQLTIETQNTFTPQGISGADNNT